MAPDVVIFVVIACHFRNENELCETATKRLDEAVRIYRSRFPRKLSDYIPLMYFLVTGHCPYEKGSKNLDELMKECLVRKGIRATRIITSTGFGIASEAKAVSEQIVRSIPNHSNEVIIISSRWYFWAAGPFWHKYARRNNLVVSMARVRNTGGWRTVVIYLAYAIIVRTFFALGLSGVIEKIMNKFQAGRSEGFQFNGCA